MKSLLRSYKTAKDNSNRTGAPTPIFPFLELMDDIFGDRPLTSCSHTINSSIPTPCSSSKDNSPVLSIDSDSDTTSTPSKRKSTPQKKKFCGKRLKSEEKKDTQLEKRKLFEEKKELLLFLNNQKNDRNKAIIEALRNKKND